MYLQDIDNIPFEYGSLESLTLERFDALLESWSLGRQQ